MGSVWFGWWPDWLCWVHSSVIALPTVLSSLETDRCLMVDFCQDVIIQGKPKVWGGCGWIWRQRPGGRTPGGRESGSPTEWVGEGWLSLILNQASGDPEFGAGLPQPL